MTDQIPHPLLAYPEAERVAYLSIIAELGNVDSKFDEQERQHLDEQLKTFEISDEGKAKVYLSSFTSRRSTGQRSSHRSMPSMTVIYASSDSRSFPACIEQRIHRGRRA